MDAQKIWCEREPKTFFFSKELFLKLIGPMGHRLLDQHKRMVIKVFKYFNSHRVPYPMKFHGTFLTCCQRCRPLQ